MAPSTTAPTFLRATCSTRDHRHCRFTMVMGSITSALRNSSHPAVAAWLEEGIEDALACLSFPEGHWRRIRATNDLERFNQELKRRTKVVRIFPNREACLRLVTALCVEQSEEWLSGWRYLDMELLEITPTETAVEDTEVSMAASAQTGFWRKLQNLWELT